MTTIEDFPLELGCEITVATTWTVVADGEPCVGWVLQEALLQSVACYIHEDKAESIQFVGIDRVADTEDFRRYMNSVETRWRTLFEMLDQQWESDRERDREYAEMSFARKSGVD